MIKLRGIYVMKSLSFAIVSSLVLSAGLPSPASAGKLLDQCNRTARAGSPDQKSASLVICYVDRMREIKLEREYIENLERAGIRVRGERSGTKKVYRNCGRIFKDTQWIEAKVKDGICSEILNAKVDLHISFAKQYCLAGRWSEAADVQTLRNKSNKLAKEYTACFSRYIADKDVGVLSEEDRTSKPTIGIIKDRDSFIRVLKGVRKRYIDDKMDQQHRELADACNALMDSLKANRPGVITKYNLQGCKP